MTLYPESWLCSHLYLLRFPIQLPAASDGLQSFLLRKIMYLKKALSKRTRYNAEQRTFHGSSYLRYQVIGSGVPNLSSGSDSSISSIILVI